MGATGYSAGRSTDIHYIVNQIYYICSITLKKEEEVVDIPTHAGIYALLRET